MAKAFSYIRFSTPDQARGDSLRRQLQAAQEWCQARGLVLDDALRDLGRSAYKGGHAQFGALRDFLVLVESGEIERGSYLIVESLDRLSREAVLDALPRLLDLIAAGITVVTLADGQEYSDGRLRADPSPLIMSLLIMMRAHEESRTKGMRVGKAWSEKRRLAAETGQAMTSICPGWIRLVGGPKRGSYELIPERAEIVRRIFRETIGGQGRRAIAKAFNLEGVPTWGVGRKRGALWHDSYIQKILRNPAVYGAFEPLSKRAGGDGSGNVRLDGYFPAAIDEAMFYRAQVAAGARREGEGRPGSAACSGEGVMGLRRSTSFGPAYRRSPQWVSHLFGREAAEQIVSDYLGLHAPSEVRQRWDGLMSRSAEFRSHAEVSRLRSRFVQLDDAAASEWRPDTKGGRP